MGKKETNKEEKTEAPKKKKRHIGLKILISFLIIFLVLPLTFILGFLVTWKPGADLSNVQEINDLSEVINNELYESLNYTTDEPNPRVELKLGEDELNSVLGLVRKKYLPATVQQYIPQIYCDVDGKEYTFGIDAKYSIIQTSVKVKTEIIEKDDEIIFQLKTIQLGHVPLLNVIEDALLKLGTKYFSDEQLNNFFKNVAGEGVGINVQFDLEHGKITYKRKDFITDLVNLINFIAGQGKSNEDAPIDLMSILIKLVQKEELFDSVVSDGLGAQIYLNSSKAENSSLIFYPNGHGDGPGPREDGYLHFDDLRTYTENTINYAPNSQLDPKIAIPDLFNFFVYGYEEGVEHDYYKTCDEVQKNDGWKGIDPGIIPDDDYRKYKGADYRANMAKKLVKAQASLKDEVEQNITAFCVKHADDLKKEKQYTGDCNLCEIKDSLLREFCSQLNIVGYNKPIFKKAKEYSANYIGLKDLDFNFVDNDTNDRLNAYVTLDINGKDTYITLETSLEDDAPTTKINFKLGETYLGQIKTSESESMSDLKSELIKLINKASGGVEGSLFSVEGDNLSIDISSMLPDGMGNIFTKNIEISIDDQLIKGTVKVHATLKPEIVHRNEEDILVVGSELNAFFTPQE